MNARSVFLDFHGRLQRFEPFSEETGQAGPSARAARPVPVSGANRPAPNTIRLQAVYAEASRAAAEFAEVASLVLEVASLVAEATGGTDPDVVIAALLHDAIEDQGVTSKVLASEFGQHVADIVLEVSDDKALPKEERKRKQVENAGKKA